MRRNIIVRNLKIWICDGHRPAYDSHPTFQGTHDVPLALTDNEYRTLHAVIARYLSKIDLRNMQQAAKEEKDGSC